MGICRRVSRLAPECCLLLTLIGTIRPVTGVPFRQVTVEHSNSNPYHRHHYQDDDDNDDESIEHAIQLLDSHGVQLCLLPRSSFQDDIITAEPLRTLQLCTAATASATSTSPHRRLQKEQEVETSVKATTDYSWIYNLLAAFTCVCVAALAAGLTLGMLGLDPLLLLIKERAADSESERARARKLLPIVQQHHRLLVTLLLMNSIANEALPIFLEALVPPSVAVLLSVTLVLFFGEIIPSAIFTGPDQLEIASRLTGVVQTAMFLLYPLAGPIAKLLDYVLHDDSAQELSAYNRGELSALIRIQYEDRLANKQKRKRLRQQAAAATATGTGMLIPASDHVGALDFTNSHHPSHQQSIRANINHLEHLQVATGGVPVASQLSVRQTSNQSTVTSPGHYNRSERESYERPGLERSNSIHVDEISMVEGALQMRTKVALDVYTSIRRAFFVPADMILNERNMVQIYASGFSRIPVYAPVVAAAAAEADTENDADNADDDSPPMASDAKCHIVGILITKQLIVVDPGSARSVQSLPLYKPVCVSPTSSLVDLLNLFQTGGRAMHGGHLALVCARPRLGNKALKQGDPLPKAAGLMGIITLEDVLEALLQEQIYDEMDRYEREAERLSIMVVRHWRRFVRRKNRGSLEPAVSHKDPSMLPVVVQAMATAGGPAALEEGFAAESTALLSGQSYGTSTL